MKGTKFIMKKIRSREGEGAQVSVKGKIRSQEDDYRKSLVVWTLVVLYVISHTCS